MVRALFASTVHDSCGDSMIDRDASPLPPRMDPAKYIFLFMWCAIYIIIRSCHSAYSFLIHSATMFRDFIGLSFS